MTERFEVQRLIGADPTTIFEVLRSPDGHVQIDSSGMLMSASGDKAEKVGDEFVVHMDREALNDYPIGRYDVTVRIVTYDQDRPTQLIQAGTNGLSLNLLALKQKLNIIAIGFISQSQAGAQCGQRFSRWLQAARAEALERSFQNV